MSAGQAIGDLEGLTRLVRDKSQQAAAATLAQARQQAEQLTQEAGARAKEHEEELVHAGLNTVERARKRIISQAQLRLRGELLERKAAILTDIIDEVRGRLERMRADEKYLDLLLALVRGALAGEPAPGRVLIYLNQEDLQNYGSGLRGQLPKELGLKPGEMELLAVKIAGGAIIELPERRLQFDSSLEQILSEFKPQIERLVQEEVFVAPEAQRPSEERGETTHGNDAG